MYNLSNIEFGQYIDGVWQDSDKSIVVINPADNQKIGLAPNANKSQIKNAIRAANRAFKKANNTNAWIRKDYMLKIANCLKNYQNEIAYTISIETGKPLEQAEREVNIAYNLFIFLGNAACNINGKILSHFDKNMKYYISYEPVGVSVAYLSWNFPLLLAARKIAAAMAAGCSIICRPSEETPGSVWWLGQCCHESGIINGLVNIINADPDDFNEVIMNEPSIRKISFTGSTKVGKHLLKEASNTIKKSTMELGGHAPVIICKEINNLKEIVSNSVKAKFNNAGQVCTSPTRFFVESEIYDDFVSLFIEKSKLIKLGRGTDKKTEMGALINQKRLDHITRLINLSIEEGGKVLLGGKPALVEGLEGFFYEPTIIVNLDDSATIMNEEPFGPIAIINKFDDIEEAISRSNKLEYALAAYVFCNSLYRSDYICSKIESGMIGLNNYTISTYSAPFGGIKQSGFGLENGIEGIYEYLKPRIIASNFTNI